MKHIEASSVRTSPPPKARWIDAGSERIKSVSPSRSHRNDQLLVGSRFDKPSPDDSNLRKRFVRDDGRSNVAEDIEDELSGPTNIQSTTGRPRNHASSRLDLSHKPRASSPSDIRPTEFLTHDNAKKLSPARRSNEVGAVKERIPVMSLVCSSMQLNSGVVDLVWDEETCSFYVLHDGQLQRVTEKKELASIGPKIQWIIRSNSAAKVILKCAADSTSNGKILIEFMNLAGRQDFIKRISRSIRPEPRHTDQDLERFKKTFERLSGEFSRHAAVRTPREHAPDRHQAFHATSDFDDKIIYESEVPDEEQSADFVPASQQALKQTMLELQNHDAPHDPENDEAKQPSFRGKETRVTRRSLGVSKPVIRSVTPPRWTQHNDLTSWRHPVVYPPLPALRRVTIDKEDIGRLDEGEFLNDTILSFALREIEESMPPQRREEIYMFNTFFYTALSTKLGRKAFNFEAVKTWTRKIDIFKYPFVVVPINVSLHWFVAIICNLPSVKSPPQDDAAMDDIEEIEPVDDFKQQFFGAAKVEAKDLSEPDDDPKSSQTPNARMSQLSLQDGDAKQAGDARAMKLNKTRKYGSKKHAPPVRKLKPKGPFIITLDSLNQPRSPEVRYLKDYIAAEAMDKLGVVLDPKEFQGITAKGIPEQNNFCDCGIFAVRYIRALAEDPHGFIKDILDRQVDRQRFDGFDPSEVRDELRSHLLELSKVNEEEFKAKRQQKHQAKREALQKPAEHDRPASSPAGPLTTESENSARPEMSVALDLAEMPSVANPAVRDSAQQHGQVAVSSSPAPHYKKSLSDVLLLTGP
jgi:sentrin-specific protease 7